MSGQRPGSMHPHEHPVQLRQGPPWPRLACSTGTRDGPMAAMAEG
jgi:hypothetical protein